MVLVDLDHAAAIESEHTTTAPPTRFLAGSHTKVPTRKVTSRTKNPPSNKHRSKNDKVTSHKIVVDLDAEVLGSHNHIHGDRLANSTATNMNRTKPRTRTTAKTTAKIANRRSIPQNNPAPQQAIPTMTTRTNDPKDNHRNKTIIVLLLLIACLLLAIGGFLAMRLGIFQTKTASSPSSAAPVSPSPTLTASLSPTMTQHPSPIPSSIPTNSPSNAPSTTDIFVEPNPARPEEPAYFNYDNTSSFGPPQWMYVNMSQTYYQEFGADGYGVWDGHLRFHVSNPTLNRCDTIGKQSPIYLQRTRGIPGACTATHQIRTRAGVHRLQSSDIEKRIEGNKLRLILPRRPCLDPKDLECRRRAPPSADFPNYSSDETHYSDMLNLDVKIPGEHVLFDTEAFDAELQMLHIHLNASRMAQIGVPVRATEGAFHEPFQVILDQFQILYDQNMADCEAHRGNTTHMDGGRRALDESPNDNAERRSLQNHTDAPSQRFDPYKDFLHDVFFYRYEGSATEPPCMSMTWFVMTHPVIIGTQQLRQTKKLLFTNVDETCQPTSVHNADQSVARPLQPLGLVNFTVNGTVISEDRAVMLCKAGDFLPDD